jgi:hypothetical protein
MKINKNLIAILGLALLIQSSICNNASTFLSLSTVDNVKLSKFKRLF